MFFNIFFMWIKNCIFARKYLHYETKITHIGHLCSYSNKLYEQKSSYHSELATRRK